MLLMLVPWGGARAQHNVIRFAQTDIQEILDTHNELRRSIYNAANMRELVSFLSVAFLLVTYCVTQSKCPQRLNNKKSVNYCLDKKVCTLE